MPARISDERIELALGRARRFVFGATDQVRRAQLDRVRTNFGLSRDEAIARAGGFGRDNVVGLSTGPRVRSGQEQDEECIRVLVRRKAASRADVLAAGDRPIPATFGGVPTDVVEVAEPAAAPGAGLVLERGSLVRSTFQARRGTLTGPVVGADGERYLLSCSHVLALPADFPAVGDPVSDAAHTVATLRAFVDLSAHDDARPVLADVALCKAAAGVSVADAWPDDASAPVPPPGFLGSTPTYTVFGAATAAPVAGLVVREQRDVRLLPPGSSVDLLYAAQVALTSGAGAAIAAAGDSGACVRDATGRLVGMVVGRSADGATIWFTPWEAVQTCVNGLTAPQG